MKTLARTTKDINDYCAIIKTMTRLPIPNRGTHYRQSDYRLSKKRARQASIRIGTAYGFPSPYYNYEGF